jgi:tRNA threonylcarbamoyladenosine biosynthesis protein TsaE
MNVNTLELFSRSPEQTRRVGMRLGGLLQSGDLVCLQGDLGAGKTTLVQGLAQGWGSLDDVSSPTFMLVNIYRRPDANCLFHLDSYRIESIPEAEELDLDNMLMQGPLVVEWPERIKAILPAAYLWIQLTYMAEEHRSMLFSASGEHHLHLLADFRRTVIGAV